MAPRITSFGRTGTPDPALAQNAQTPFDGPERQVIDQQITDMQRYLAAGMANGVVAVWVKIHAASSAIAAGDVLCRPASTSQEATLANESALATAGAVLGVALGAGSPGSRIPIAVKGAVDPAITGLAASAGICRVSTLGKPEKADPLLPTDAVLGHIDAKGWLVLSMGAASPQAIGNGSLTLAVTDTTPVNGLVMYNPSDPNNPYLILDLDGSVLKLPGAPILAIPQTGTPTAIANYLQIWFDGSNLKARLPSGAGGAVKTFTWT